MDPLAELSVKIDAKSIGVGQYQHDVDQTKLKVTSDQTVESCVNLVGVNVNTGRASTADLRFRIRSLHWHTEYGLPYQNGPVWVTPPVIEGAENGAKAYEQCAGFLRIPQAKNPLDNLRFTRKATRL